jgi:uncharacterized protein (UPF0332 family)
MAFDWREYLVVAKELAADGRESTSRTSISRAYYCTFHLGLEFATSKGFVDPKKSTHQALWKWYEGQTDKNLKALGTLGNRLKSSRVDADYKSSRIPRLADVVKDTLQRAEEFKSKLP